MTNWTKDNIPNLREKVFIVTGANSGIGYESSFALAEKGATVIMACRNLERGQRSMDAIKKEIPSAKLELMELDLASLASIRKFAETFSSKYDRLDVLINSGGPIVAARSLTKDGFESHFGVGHLGHFALTALLLDVILKTPSSRIVTVGSRMHWDRAISTFGQWISRAPIRGLSRSARAMTAGRSFHAMARKLSGGRIILNSRSR
jgi:NAD(P)-dependent dehydrogenase (short-subunit alcohol dehydrogenase family)